MEKQELKIRLERTVNGKTHVTHLHAPATMHLDIIDALVGRAIRMGVSEHIIEQIFENGYQRED